MCLKKQDGQQNVESTIFDKQISNNNIVNHQLYHISFAIFVPLMAQRMPIINLFS